MQSTCFILRYTTLLTHDASSPWRTHQHETQYSVIRKAAFTDWAGFIHLQEHRISFRQVVISARACVRVQTLQEVSFSPFIFNLPDFRLPLRCGCDLRSSGILRTVEWWFCTDVSWQPIGPIFKGQEVLHHWRWDQQVVPKRRFRTTTQRCVIFSVNISAALQWSYTSTPPHVFMAWCLITHRDNCTVAS
jgi:hypothetical protein